MNVNQELQRALGLHQAGRTADAAEIYAAILRVQPDNADALNLLGAALIDCGDPEAGARFCRAAVQAAPDFFAAHVTLGNALQAMGQVDEAVRSFERAVALNGGSVSALNNLASALNAAERFADARDVCSKALGLAPAMAELHSNLGNALMGLREMDGAEEAFRRAIEINPSFAAALYNLGTLLSGKGEAAAAIPYLEKALEVAPPDANMHYNLAMAYRVSGAYEKAEAAFRSCLDRDPSHEDARHNLAATWQDLGRDEEAERMFRGLLAENPDSPELHWNLALVLLQQGNFAEGWREYEWRWRNPAFTSPVRTFREPAWDGADAPGKTILVYAEQGFGDAIQMARFFPLVAKKCARLVVECRPGLERLFATIDGVDDVATFGGELPGFDLHAATMSLPHLLGIAVETIPTATPYLSVPADAAPDPRILKATGRKIGIVWGGDPSRQRQEERNCGLERFVALGDRDDVSLFSLQVGERAEGLKAASAEARIVDLQDGLRDFADTAAAIRALDLVIAVDTAVGHLGGALEVPTWILLPKNGSYLWMRARETSVWYPTVRLFRQSRQNDWSEVFARVRSALDTLPS